MKVAKDGKFLYYTVHDRQPSLTSPYALTTAFRSGNGRERQKHHDFDSLSAMDALIRRLLARRIRDGYHLLYAWSRDARWSESSIAPRFGLPEAGLLARASALLEHAGRPGPAESEPDRRLLG